jgi:L-ascorbate metabolism protein UlaG (beta-lactamase superfamily)
MYGCSRMRRAVFVAYLISGCLVVPVPFLIAADKDQTTEYGTIRVTYLGNAGYQIENGKTVLIVDPYVSQFRPGGMGPTDINDKSDPILTPDTDVIDKHISHADYILITHSHSDHLLDAPYIATKTHAVIIGSAGTARIARVRGVPEDQTITVKGGEEYDFGDFSVRVIPGLHSPLLKKRYNNTPWAEDVPKDLKTPIHESAYAEGGTFNYLVRMAGHQIFIMGSMNYIEREVEGLRSDIAIIGSGVSRKEIYDYTGRLMRALGCPATVFPTHWDSLDSMSHEQAVMGAQEFANEVKTACPKTNVIIPDYFKPMQFK